MAETMNEIKIINHMKKKMRTSNIYVKKRIHSKIVFTSTFSPVNRIGRKIKR